LLLCAEGADGNQYDRADTDYAPDNGTAQNCILQMIRIACRSSYHVHGTPQMLTGMTWAAMMPQALLSYDSYLIKMSKLAWWQEVS
jgi:hypothetical protein